MSEKANKINNTTEQIEATTTGSNVLLYPATETAVKTDETTLSAEAGSVESPVQAQADISETEAQAQTEADESALPAQPKAVEEDITAKKEAASAATSSVVEHTSSPDEEDLFEEEDYTKANEEKKQRSFFHFHSRRKAELSRDELILSRISDEDLMEYLRLEQHRQELLQKSKEVREKRIWSAFLLAISLLAVVLVIYFLKDNPTILVSILYTIGILVALYIWNRPKDKGSDKKTK